jgi:hypothetical protein
LKQGERKEDMSKVESRSTSRSVVGFRVTPMPTWRTL